ncbi:hypothetical protein J2Z79_001780 [Symbiobacterium terraclitae]|uniref:Putative Se/S carrier protein-like domain-containing protein n=1 Tax=Symbiobacterium terraclitae TaxID=557451 RepID=A0ABS4JS59_9FIRM|nr:hypothetical protein [Symbiobacterium terraclitae]
MVLFHTTSMALKAEKALKAQGIAVRLVPTPRQFSSDCGFALRFDWAERERVERLLEDGRVETAGVHELDG